MQSMSLISHFEFPFMLIFFNLCNAIYHHNKNYRVIEFAFTEWDRFFENK